ncbi:hypothetical protein K439DRAFT_1616527 [Ramaria rubella]|nr:hypothetical protein K439DRAFT_1616527 [Ramaria rubella]
MTTKPTDTELLMTWSNTNDRIVGGLCQAVTDPLMREIENYITATEAWDHLKKKTHHASIVSKLNAIHTAVCTRFTSHETISATITEFKDLIAIIYDNKEPTREEWTIVLLLQALADGEFEWICPNLISFMTTSVTTLTSDDIIHHLETEAQEARVQGMLSTQETALATRGTPPKTMKSSTHCANCNTRGHTIKNCWEKGGGNAGKAPDWWKEMKAKKESESKGKSSNRKLPPQANAVLEHEDSSGSKSCYTAVPNKIATTPDGIRILRHFQSRPSDGDVSCSVTKSCSIQWDNTNT